MKYNAKLSIFLVALALASLLLSACSVVPGLGGGGSGNPIPTPRSAEDVGTSAQSAAEDTPEGTWESYVRDAIAEQVTRQKAQITMLERYENPDITVQNVGGIAVDVDIVEDRTSWNLNGNTASATVDYDIRLTYADGDTETRTCSYFVVMELDTEDNVWYVLNPQPLAFFSVCAP